MPNATSPKHTFAVKGNDFVLDGKPFQILSGEMHYPRIPKEYWRDRIQKAKALGLNTLCTYVFWNVHEPRPGKFVFDGNADLVQFIKIAQEEGLWVIVRPGPFVCSEWEFGGYPAWLLKDPNMVVRSLYPKYVKYVERYMARLGKELAPLMLSNGGPIIMAQVENEYGTYGQDHAYMAWCEKVMCDNGFDCQLFTSDGATDPMLTGGTLPHLPATINFGIGAEGEFAKLAKHRPQGPRMNAEYWCGWFDHWGSKHMTTSVETHANDLKWMLSNGCSFSLYMLHGGTNFGFMAGANWDEKYEPDTTSYDYDSPLNEAGEPTAKFEAFRKVIQDHTGTVPPALPAPLPKTSISTFELYPIAGLKEAIVKSASSETPKTMEEMDQAYGYIVYQKTVGPVKGELKLNDLKDYALVLANGKPLGQFVRWQPATIQIDLPAETVLEIVVHNLSRINFGPKIVSERKGILGGVTIDAKALMGWESHSIPCEDIKKLSKERKQVHAPAFYRGEFEIETAGDTYLDMRGWGIGAVWVNGRNIGRYWHIGPQQALFVPGVWLKKGKNEVVVLDLLEGKKRTLCSSSTSIWSEESL